MISCLPSNDVNAANSYVMGAKLTHKNIASLLFNRTIEPKIATITSELETHPSNRCSEVWRHQRIASLNRDVGKALTRVLTNFVICEVSLFHNKSRKIE